MSYTNSSRDCLFFKRFIFYIWRYFAPFTFAFNKSLLFLHFITKVVRDGWGKGISLSFIFREVFLLPTEKISRYLAPLFMLELNNYPSQRIVRYLNQIYLVRVIHNYSFFSSFDIRLAIYIKLSTPHNPFQRWINDVREIDEISMYTPS